MLSFHAHLKVFVATAPCDLRMSFNGLWAAVQQRLDAAQAGQRSAVMYTLIANCRLHGVEPYT